MSPLHAQAEQALRASELVELPAVRDAWRDADWRESGTLTTDYAFFDALTGAIICSTVLGTGPHLVGSLLAALGAKIAHQFSPSSKARWASQLVFARPSQIDAFAGRLAQQKCETYKDLVDSFSSAVDRLVALHIANALIANRVPIAEGVNLDIRKWGATEKFAAQLTPYSLIPLVSAYCPQFSEFSRTFSAFVVSGLKDVSESSVRAELKDLVRSLL